MKLYEIRKNLNAIKHDNSQWQMFKCQNGENEDLRYALALALQYERKKEDEALIRYVLNEEIKWKSIDPYQGYDETLMILSFLLSRYRKVEDAFLFEQAKYANFDTACGYSSLFAFSAGVKKTWEYVSAFELNEGNPIFHEEKELYEDLTEADVEEFLAAMSDKYPEERSLLSSTEQFEEALSLDDMEACRSLWPMVEKEVEPKELFELSAQAGFYDKAIECGEVLLLKEESPGRKINLAQRLMRIYCDAGDFHSVLKKAKEGYGYLKQNETSESPFGYRQFAELFFKTSREMAEAGDMQTAGEVFALGDKVYREQGNMSLAIAEAAYQCCRMIQNEALSYYEEEYKREKKDHDSFMARIRAADRGE